MDRRLMIALVGGSMAVLVSQAVAQDPAPPPSTHPITVTTWGGAWTGYDLWDNQDKLKKTDKDKVDTHWYPDKSTIDVLKKSDIIYVQNHGGTLSTSSPMSKKSERFTIKDLHFPTDDAVGPSLILNWGCENGNDKGEVKDKAGNVTEHVNYLDRRARGFGVEPDSLTKVYIAPKIAIGAMEDDFQEKFFEEFGKGDVTAEEAARRAFKVWHDGWGIGAPELWSSVVPDKFEDAIGMQGNGALTLDQIRKNLDERDRLAKEGKTTGSASDGTASAGDPPGGVVDIGQDQKNWYCTNRPEIRSEFPPPPWAIRGDTLHPTSRDLRDMVLQLIELMASQGMDRQPLEEFMNLAENRIWTDSPEEIAKRAAWDGRPEGLPDPKDKAAVDAWRERMAASFFAEYVRVLSSGGRDMFSARMGRLGERIRDFDPRASELALRIAGMAAE